MFHIFTDPGIFLVVIFFIYCLIYLFSNFKKVSKSLNDILTVLQKFKADELIYRFKEFDNCLMENSYINSYWLKYKENLIFNRSKTSDVSSISLNMKSINNDENIQKTDDPIFYFNEETLVHSKYNYKFLNAAPTILTGLGPLFTFLSIAIGFSNIDFSTNEQTLASVTSLLGALKVAAVVSVLAVSGALLFTLIERIFYNKLCIQPLNLVIKEFNRLFERITSEKFLVMLLRENKTQNVELIQSISKLNECISHNFSSQINQIEPYLENIIYGINKLRTAMDKKDAESELFE